MRVMEKNQKVQLKLEDRGSNELFAACPIDQYPGPAVEAVTDSSRYFVIKIVDDNGRSAFIGIGFSDRSDSFDLNVALQDHFKGVTKEKEIAKEDVSSKPQLDLAFKEGQTIKVNINIPKSDKSRPRAKGGAGLLPPPPGGVGAIKPPPASATAPGASSLTPLSSPISNSVDLLGGLDLSNLSLQQQPPSNLPPPASTQSKSDDPWGAFESAEVSDGKVSKEWVGF